MAYVTQQLTIKGSAGSRSMSSGVDCTGYTILRIIMPDVWDAAPISFQLSPDGVEYHDLFHTNIETFNSYEVVVPIIAAGVVVAMPTGTGHGVSFLKIRSGTRTVPVQQSADRTFTVVLEPVAASGDGAPGSSGPTGPVGPSGPAGAVGATGPMGPTGMSGAIGTQGATGPTGSVGSAGPAGAVGPTGPATSKGVIDGSAAAAGDKGEYFTANSTAAVNLVTLVTANVASVSLPPGDWDIWGAVIFQPTSTGPNSLSAAISGVSAALPSNSDITAGFGTMSELWASSMPSGKRQVLLTGQCTSNSAALKNVYLVAQASFGGGSVAVSGYISARRAR